MIKKLNLYTVEMKGLSLPLRLQEHQGQGVGLLHLGGVLGWTPVHIHMVALHSYRERKISIAFADSVLVCTNSHRQVSCKGCSEWLSVHKDTMDLWDVFAHSHPSYTHTHISHTQLQTSHNMFHLNTWPMALLKFANEGLQKYPQESSAGPISILLIPNICTLFSFTSFSGTSGSRPYKQTHTHSSG